MLSAHAPEPTSTVRLSWHDRKFVLACEVLGGFRLLQRCEVRITLAEGRLLFWMRENRGERRLGFASLADFSTELLHLDSTTTRNRIAVSSIADREPRVREALLRGHMTPCQALVLQKVLSGPETAAWVRRCRDLTVRELRKLLKEAAPPSDEAAAVDDPDEEPLRNTGFLAPASTCLLWEEALEVARRVLGYQASVGKCVEAILAEGSPETAADDGHPDLLDDAYRGEHWLRGGYSREFRHRPPYLRLLRGGRDEPRPVSRHLPPALRRSLRTLKAAMKRVKQIERLEGSDAPRDTGEALVRLRTLRRSASTLRLLEGRLLENLVALGAPEIFARRHLGHFVKEELHLSERTARNLLAEARLFARLPLLARACADGRIGPVQAFLIERVAPANRRPAYVARAETVTARQFDREMRFLERLQKFAPRVRIAGPLPDPGLEESLRAELFSFGLSESDVKKRLKARHVAGADLEESPDPACSPSRMKRLEALLDLVILARCEAAVAFKPAEAVEEVPSRRQVFPEAGTDEQRMTAAAATAAAERHLFAAEDDLSYEPPLPEPSRPLPAALTTRSPELRTLEGPLSERLIRIGFSVPRSVLRHFWRALRAILRESGQILFPAWAAVTVLLARALNVWRQVDPDTIPGEHAILERDGYRCTAPGCGSRSHLEVHHIHFRSRGGTDHAWNRAALCAAHHRILLHDMGKIRVTGKAPHDLHWEFASDGERGPMWVLHGERITGGWGARGTGRG